MSISLVHNERVCAIDTERVGINLLYQYQSIWQFFSCFPMRSALTVTLISAKHQNIMQM